MLLKQVPFLPPRCQVFFFETRKMDSNHVSILAREEPQGPGTVEQQFEDLIQQLIETGYGVADGLLPPALVRQLAINLRVLFENDELHKARIGKQEKFQQNGAVRTDLIHWLDAATTDESEIAFLKVINDFIAYLNRTCFTAIRTCEFHYALYEPGSFYRRHLDQFSNDSGRKFSIVCYLNDEWQPADGGELALYLPTGDVTILPKGGRLVFFKADEIEHEVKVAHRERMSLTGWLKDGF